MLRVLPSCPRFFGVNHYSYLGYLDYDERPHLHVGYPTLCSLHPLAYNVTTRHDLGSHAGIDFF